MSLSCPFAGRYADPIKHTVDARIGMYWHDNAFNHATGPQSGGNPADCRPTDMEFARQPHPIGANQFRVCVHSAFKRLQEKLVNFKRQFGRSSPWIARCSMFLHNATSAAFNPSTNLPALTIISRAGYVIYFGIHSIHRSSCCRDTRFGLLALTERWRVLWSACFYL